MLFHSSSDTDDNARWEGQCDMCVRVLRVCAYVCECMCVTCVCVCVHVFYMYVCGWVEDQDVLIDLIINYKAHHVA